MGHTEHSKRSSAHHRRKKSLIVRLFSLALSVCVLGSVCIVALFFYIGTQSLPAAQVQQTSQLLGANGEKIDAIYAAQNRQIVELNEISHYVKEAVVAVEDRRFYDHFGIDLYGTARAVWTNLRSMAKLQGASTLSQQLARNLYLTHDRTWDRKLKEAAYALQLESSYSKDEILELYLNTVYFGHSLYGIETAAQAYFGKSAKDLTLAESALLAGVPKGARYYSPYLEPDNAKQRQKIVLQAMVEVGSITQAVADAAYLEELTYQPLQDKRSSEAPYFSDYVRQVAVQELGMDEELLESGGVKIYTTLDLHMQQVAEEVIDHHLQRHPELQAALIAIDPRTGYIKAMVGGRDYKENQFNRVFATTRQPGSSFKPIMYLAALQQEGFHALTRYRSEPTSFTYDEGRETYTPSNFGGKYANDDITLREAIARSDNIYAVHTIMDIGFDNVINTARTLGIESHLSPLPSLALGTFPISPFEMATAYSVIAGQGVRTEPTAILRIEDAYGRVLHDAEPHAEQVIDPTYSYVLTKLMESVFEPGGTAARVASGLKRPVAGKTGTTSSDAWMVGFTPELVTAVWVGYDRGRTISAVEAAKAAPIFAEFTEAALKHVPPKLFSVPHGVVSLYVDPKSGTIATPGCSSETRLEYFVRGTEPTMFCSELEPQQEKDELLERHQEQGAGQEERSWWEDLKRWWHG